MIPGHKVEMTERTDLTGSTSVIRFNGQGLVIRYRKTDDVWQQDAGSMILGLDDGTWSFDNWLEGVAIT